MRELADFASELTEVQFLCVDVLGRAGRVDLLLKIIAGSLDDEEVMSIQAALNWLVGLNLVRAAGDDNQDVIEMRAKLVAYLEARDRSELIGGLR